MRVQHHPPCGAGVLEVGGATLTQIQQAKRWRASCVLGHLAGNWHSYHSLSVHCTLGHTAWTGSLFTRQPHALGSVYPFYRTRRGMLCSLAREAGIGFHAHPLSFQAGRAGVAEVAYLLVLVQSQLLVLRQILPGAAPLIGGVASRPAAGGRRRMRKFTSRPGDLAVLRREAEVADLRIPAAPSVYPGEVATALGASAGKLRRGGVGR